MWLFVSVWDMYFVLELRKKEKDTFYESVWIELIFAETKNKVVK